MLYHMWHVYISESQIPINEKSKCKTSTGVKLEWKLFVNKSKDSSDIFFPLFFFLGKLDGDGDDGNGSGKLHKLTTYIHIHTILRHLTLADSNDNDDVDVVVLALCHVMFMPFSRLLWFNQESW